MAEIRALEAYLRTLDAGGLARAPGGKVDSLLPFAIALGVSKAWERELAGAFEERPAWYRTTAGASGPWATRLGFMSWRFGCWYDWSSPSRLDSAMATSYGGSGWGGGSGYGGGSGFGGGGGFSGGGFGGGGGSGF